MATHGVLFECELERVRRLGEGDELAAGTLITRPPVSFERQVGSTCGPVALRVAALQLGVADLSVEQIVAFGKEKGFTSEGECFSVDWMAETAAALLPGVQAEPVPFPSPADLLHDLALQHALFLVPYDADKDSGPCLRAGQAAHWALLFGFFVRNSSAGPVDSDWGRVVPAEEDIFLVAVQGKSRSSALWPYRALAESNAQLADSARPLVKPEGGVAAGLRGRAVRLRPPRSD